MITVAPRGPSGVQRQGLGPHPDDDLGPGPAPTAHARGQRERAPRHGDAPAAPSRLEHAGQQVHAGAAREPGHEDVGRAVVEVLGRRHLLEHPVVEHGDPVAHRHRLDLVVGDVEGGGAEPLLQGDDVGPGLRPAARRRGWRAARPSRRPAGCGRWPGPGPPAGAGRPRAAPACGRGSGSSPRVAAASLTRRVRSSCSMPRWRRRELDVLGHASGAGRGRRSGRPWPRRGPSARRR